MASLLQSPLSTQVNIVDDQGRPTPQFARMLQKLGVGSGLTTSNGQITLATMAAKTILANKTTSTSAPTACTLSDILDFVSTTQGSILYRGASGWQVLPPGTSGQFLKTQGTGADPVWAAAGGGGGGGTPTIRSSNLASSSWSSVAIPLPTGTAVGDVVFIHWENGFAISASPTGWTPLWVSNNGGTWTNQAVAAKIMTSADISAGSVTVTAGGGFNGTYGAICITGSSMTALDQFTHFDSPSNGSVASVSLNGLSGSSPTDLVIGFLSTRGAMTVTVSSNVTIIQTVNAASASGIFFTVSSAGIGKLGLNETATLPVSNNGCAWSMVSLK